MEDMGSPSALEAAMLIIVGVFDKYAGTDGRKETLSKAEVKTLIQKELPNFVQGGEREQVEKMMMELSLDGDQEVNFMEFMCHVSGLTTICKALVDQLKQSAQ